ncbi:hypothetical protein C174_19301 [Bacillus mycoides FSL H7-687]|nr:hypothetical protein C174_19301 [Bacillus mycoides FSL H7-687]
MILAVTMNPFVDIFFP